VDFQLHMKPTGTRTKVLRIIKLHALQFAYKECVLNIYHMYSRDLTFILCRTTTIILWECYAKDSTYEENM
jgi:hypothetical protein